MSFCANPYAPVLCGALLSCCVFPFPKSKQELVNSIAGISATLGGYGLYRALDFQKTAKWALSHWNQVPILAIPLTQDVLPAIKGNITIAHAECIPATYISFFNYHFSHAEQELFATQLLMGSIAAIASAVSLYILNAYYHQDKAMSA